MPEYESACLSSRRQNNQGEHLRHQHRPELQGLRRFLLATANAHGLYARFGFKIVTAPERMMEIKHPDPYGVARPLA